MKAATTRYKKNFDKRYTKLETKIEVNRRVDMEEKRAIRKKDKA